MNKKTFFGLLLSATIKYCACFFVTSVVILSVVGFTTRGSHAMKYCFAFHAVSLLFFSWAQLLVIGIYLWCCQFVWVENLFWRRHQRLIYFISATLTYIGISTYFGIHLWQKHKETLMTCFLVPLSMTLPSYLGCLAAMVGRGAITPENQTTPK